MTTMEQWRNFRLRAIFGVIWRFLIKFFKGKQNSSVQRCQANRRGRLQDEGISESNGIYSVISDYCFHSFSRRNSRALSKRYGGVRVSLKGRCPIDQLRRSIMNKWSERIPEKYWAYGALLLWGALSYTLLNKAPYGIDEGAARALLLVWSVADGVASPVVTLGIPDFRAIFFIPIGYLWVGSMMAAKILSLIVMSCAVWGIHRWRQESGHSESALLASGLLLISPLLVEQIDTISVAPYLLVVFSLGAWSDRIYRNRPQAFGGMYFFQIFLCFVSITLHPAGLAYPLSLLWGWYGNPISSKQRNYYFAGVGCAAFLGLLLTVGWRHAEWFANPINSLTSLFFGSAATDTTEILKWIGGIAMMAILLAVIWKQARSLWADFLGRTLLIAVVMGVMTGDATWSIIVLVTCLYWGFPMLMLRRSASASGFWGQRGMAMTLLFVLSMASMLADKAHYQKVVVDGDLSKRDELIKTLAEDRDRLSNQGSGASSVAKKPVRVASQWPGLTMLACRCDALPLPPPAKDGEALLSMLHGINYLIFDPRDPANRSLAQNLATMGAGRVETVALQAGGVIVEVKGNTGAQTP
jgi:hypothetical protein